MAREPGRPPPVLGRIPLASSSHLSAWVAIMKATGRGLSNSNLFSQASASLLSLQVATGPVSPMVFPPSLLTETFSSDHRLSEPSL